MIALLRYQAAIGLRSHRWIFPLIVYVALVAAGDAGGAESLSGSLAWSAAMLVPVVAFATRSMLIAEPDAARACVSAAAGPAGPLGLMGPVRAHLAALLVALAGGVILAVAGACAALLTSQPVLPAHSALPAKIGAAVTHPGVLLAGLATAAVCLLVASAIGALCNPPLLRHRGLAVLATLTVAIVAVATDISPAGAALSHAPAAQAATAPAVAQWPGTIPAIASVGLLAITWTASAFAAARRG